MRLKTKIICFILIISIICMNAITIVAFTDVNNELVFYEAIEALSALGILKGYEDGTFKPEGTITRAEFAAVITRIMGLADLQIGGTDTIFEDVKAGHWASGNIKIAADMGIIKGFGDGKFLPDDPVTYEQAVKMIVAALGYEPKAMEQGGYPSGYLMVASEKDITRSAEGKVGEMATRGMVAQLLYNSLEVPMFELSGVGESTTYVVNKEKTFLSTGLGLIRVKNGQVTGNQYTTLESPATSVRSGEIELDGKIFVTPDADKLYQYLGYSVTYYYKHDNTTNDDVLVLLMPDSNKNHTLTIVADNIEKYEDNILYYSINENEDDTINIKDDVIIIYNGKKYDKDKPVSLDIESGEIKLLDFDSDNNYDIIFVNEYKNYVVENTPNTTDYIIIDKYFGTRLELNPNKRGVAIQFLKNGSPIQFTDIKKGDIISVMESNSEEGNRVVTVLVASNNVVTGTVTEIGDNNIRVINGKSYTISDYYLRAIKEKNKPDIKIDDKGTFYLDAEGKIAHIVLEAARGTDYAYLINAATKSSGLEGTLQLKLYIPSGTTSGSVQIKDCAEKVKIDGKTYDNASEILSLLASANDTTNTDPLPASTPENPLNSEDQRIYAQLIKYATNSSGKIDLIDTLHKGGHGEESEHLKQVYSDGNQELTYYSTNRTFRLGNETKVTIDSSTKIFYVPQKRSETSKYVMKSYSYFVNGRKYKLEAFDFSSVNVAKAIVLYGDDTDQLITETTPISIVDSISEVINDQGETVLRLSYHLNGNKETVDVRKSDPEILEQVKSLKTGDIIRFSKKDNLYIADIDILLKIDTLTSYRDQITETINEQKIVKHYGYKQSEFEAVYGTVYSKAEDNSQILIYNQDIMPKETEEIRQDSIRTFSVSGSIKYYVIRKLQANTQVELKEKFDDLYVIDYLTSKQDASLLFLYTYEDRIRTIIKIDK